MSQIAHSKTKGIAYCLDRENSLSGCPTEHPMPTSDLPTTENFELREEHAPIGSDTSSLMPKRRVLFFSCIVDLLLCGTLTAMIGAVLFAIAPPRLSPVEREDRWRFDVMPSNDEALLAWSKGRRDLSNFRVERIAVANQLVLRYARPFSEGPAQPDWRSLGYRMAYLISVRRPDGSSIPESTPAPGML